MNKVPVLFVITAWVLIVVILAAGCTSGKTPVPASKGNALFAQGENEFRNNNLNAAGTLFSLAQENYTADGNTAAAIRARDAESPDPQLPQPSSPPQQGTNIKAKYRQQIAMKLTAAQEAEVIETIQKYATAYRKKDIRAFSALFSSDITGFGSGPDEVITNHDGFLRQIQRDMSQATIHAVEFTDRKIFGDGRVAWATSKSAITFTIDGTTKQTLCGRSTMVLKNTGSRWLIEQLHFSLPNGGQAEGQSFPGAE